jgi:hypothetical protein
MKTRQDGVLQDEYTHCMEEEVHVDPPSLCLLWERYSKWTLLEVLHLFEDQKYLNDYKEEHSQRHPTYFLFIFSLIV